MLNSKQSCFISFAFFPVRRLGYRQYASENWLTEKVRFVAAKFLKLSSSVIVVLFLAFVKCNKPAVDTMYKCLLLCPNSLSKNVWPSYATTMVFYRENGRVLHLEYGIVWCWKLDTSENGSEIPGKFWNVVFKKDGEDNLDQSCEKWSIT
jgi:hypothetical protein